VLAKLAPIAPEEEDDDEDAPIKRAAAHRAGAARNQRLLAPLRVAEPLCGLHEMILAHSAEQRFEQCFKSITLLNRPQPLIQLARRRQWEAWSLWRRGGARVFWMLTPFVHWNGRLQSAGVIRHV